MENLPVTFSIYPSTIPEDRKECLILLSRPVADDVTIDIQIENKVKQQVKFERKDDTTLLVKIPENYFQQDKIIVYVSYMRTIIGADIIQNERPCEILARTLERALDPIQLMMEALGLRQDTEADLHMLDEDLAHVVSCNLPPAQMKVLLQNYSSGSEKAGGDRKRCRFPTALHFSAYYGFEKLTEVLLESDAALPCLSVTNCDGDTVIDIANKKKFKSIEHSVENALVYERVDDLFRHEPETGDVYMEMNRAKPRTGGVVCRTPQHRTESTVPKPPQHPPPIRNRTNSVGSLCSIQELDLESRDSGVFVGVRDSAISSDSSVFGDGNTQYSLDEGSRDGYFETKSKHSHGQKIRRGDVLLGNSDRPSLGHNQSRRPSLPNVYFPIASPETEVAPPACHGPTYQNLKPTGPPPVPQKKASLPSAFDIGELQKSEIFKKRQHSTSDVN